MLKKYKPYMWGILSALAVGGLSAFFTRNNMDIYNEIKTPPLSPSGWIFPVVWTILYILMGISIAKVWVKAKEEGKDATPSVSIYVWQIAVNFVWSIIFFNFRAFLLSFIWLLLLWGLIIWMIKIFSETDKFAAWLLVPYLLWVSFAGYLNIAIWILNN